MINRSTKAQLSTSACLLAILCCVLFFSCHEVEKHKSKHLYTLYKSDDNNWTTSGRIECDSFNFITNNHVEFFVNGRKSNLKAGIIKAYNNTDYVSPK